MPAPITTPQGQIVPRSEARATIAQYLDTPAFRQAVAEALPRQVGIDRFMRVCLSTLRGNADLLACTPGSVLRALLQSAMLGLEPGSGLGHAYLVPYKAECVLILGYRGLVDLARRSGDVSSVEARVVRLGDTFRFAFGLKASLTHTPKAGPEAPVTHAYAVVHLRDGGVQYDVMTRGEVDAIRVRSRAGHAGPWVTDYAEMAKKTVLRRLAKLLPMSIEGQGAVVTDERVDAGLSSDVEIDLPFDPVALPEPEPARSAEPMATPPRPARQGRPPKVGAQPAPTGEPFSVADALAPEPVPAKPAPQQPTPPTTEEGLVAACKALGLTRDVAELRLGKTFATARRGGMPWAAMLDAIKRSLDEDRAALTGKEDDDGSQTG